MGTLVAKHGSTVGCLVATAVLVLALAVPATAQAPQTKRYKGELEGGGSISLRLNAKGDPVVDKVFMSRVPVACNEGQATIGYYEVRGSTPLLTRRKFSVRANDGTGGKAFVKGKFSRKFKRVSGRARLYGKYAAGGGAVVTECDSGKVPYTAR